MIPRIKFIAGGGALAACALIIGTARAQETYTLQPSYKSGETMAYKTIVNIEAKGPAGTTTSGITLFTTEKIKSIKEDGTITVVTTIDSGELVANDMKQPLLPPIVGQTFTTILDKSGKTLKQEGLGAGAAAGFEQLIEISRMSVAPDRPLKVGEDWKYDLSVGEGKKQKVNGVLTIVGVEKKGDLPIDTLKVKNVADLAGFGPNNNQNVHIDLTGFLDPATSRPLKTDGAVTFANTASDAKLTIKRTRLDSQGKSDARSDTKTDKN